MWQVNMRYAAGNGKMAELRLVAEYAPERITMFYTPLHEAAIFNQEAAVSFLLSAGANVNQTGKYGDTALSHAENDRVRQLLIDAGGH